MTPTASIVMIFFNSERFIREAIESVLAQTMEDWELLLVDDGSTDGSTAIAQAFGASHPGRIRYVEHANHENRGMSASRNLGIRHAGGRYIAFLDSDDVWRPEKLERQLALLDAHSDAVMVCGPSQYWHSWRTTIDDRVADHIPPLGIGPGMIEPPTLLTLALRSQARTPGPSNILLRRHIVHRVNGFEESFRGIYQLFEDQAFLAKIFLTGPVLVAGECWDRYRQHPESCVSVAAESGHKYDAGLFYLKWLSGYLSAQGVDDAAVWDALRDKEWRYRKARLTHKVRQSARHIFRSSSRN